jgi:F0F1-type ATP synthase assembly protein I
MIGCIVGGLLLGLLVDHFAHTSPACALAGVGVGLIGAGTAMYGQVRRFLK